MQKENIQKDGEYDYTIIVPDLSDESGDDTEGAGGLFAYLDTVTFARARPISVVYHDGCPVQRKTLLFQCMIKVLEGMGVGVGIGRGKMGMVCQRRSSPRLCILREISTCGRSSGCVDLGFSRFIPLSNHDHQIFT